MKKPSRTTPPTVPAFAPPPEGTLIANMLPWPVLQEEFNGLENYWAPVDGSPIPPGQAVGPALQQHRDTPASLADLRGRIPNGSDPSNELESGAPVVAAKPGAGTTETTVAADEVWFYLLLR